MAALWPESSPERAKSALHTAVYRLRRATHQRVVVLRGGVYRVDEELVTFYDVRAFERLLQRAATTSGDEAVALLQEATDLCAAPFLEHMDTEWCVAERDRLARRYLLALERLADAYAAAGEYAESIAVAERLLAQDPLREDVHARIIRAQLRLGDRAAALAQYERCAALLDDELGVAPGGELQALLSRIRA
jgi:DNA-binding SARP family transcriptional activator